MNATAPTSGTTNKALPMENLSRPFLIRIREIIRSDNVVIGVGCVSYFWVRRLRRGKPSNRGSRPSDCFRCSIRRHFAPATPRSPRRRPNSSSSGKSICSRSFSVEADDWARELGSGEATRWNNCRWKAWHFLDCVRSCNHMKVED